MVSQKHAECNKMKKEMQITRELTSTKISPTSVKNSPLPSIP